MCIYVEIKDNDLNRAIKIFKKKIKESGILNIIRNKEYYTKPSEIKRKNKNRAINRSKSISRDSVK